MNDFAIGLDIRNSGNIDIYANLISQNTSQSDYRIPTVILQEVDNLLFADNLLNDNNTYRVVSISNVNESDSDNILFDNNQIINNNSIHGTLYFYNERSSSIEISKNIINNNYTTFWSGGITLAAKNYEVYQNVITNNISSNGNGGGVMVDSVADENSFIWIYDNDISNNKAVLGGGICTFGKSTSDIFIENNTIHNNKANVGGGIYLYLFTPDSHLKFNSIAFNEAKNIVNDIEENLGGGIYISQSLNTKILNTIIAHNIGSGITFDSYNLSSILAVNSIIWDNIHEYQIENLAPVSIINVSYVNNCVISDGIAGTSPPQYFNFTNLYSMDPQFVDKYSYDWHTQYNFNNMGYGGDFETFIGLHPYNANTAISQHSRTLKSGWNWVSFPKLPRDPETNASVSFLSIANSLNPHGVKIQGEDGISNYSQATWDPHLSSVQSTKGYKIQMNQNFNHIIEGTTLNPNTVISLISGQENWIGYFLPETILLEDAFSPEVFDNIIYIKSKYGIMAKYGDVWFGTGLPKTLSFGDMVIVTVNSNIDFIWGQGAVAQRYEKEETSLFAFEEKSDYTSIFVEIDDENPPLEIAAMINGVCKGASVYEGELTEILAYLDEEDLNQEIELVFAYDAKAPAEKMNDFALVNPHSQNLEYIPLIARASVPYYYVKFAKKDNEHLDKPFMQLLQNYPNPFNPETKIQFYLSHDDNVQISVYNIKGQKVKDLFTGQKQAGKHSVIWDGKDMMNKQVSSGIYLYKLNTRHGSIQRKMTLIK